MVSPVVAEFPFAVGVRVPMAAIDLQVEFDVTAAKEREVQATTGDLELGNWVEAAFSQCCVHNSLPVAVECSLAHTTFWLRCRCSQSLQTPDLARSRI